MTKKALITVITGQDDSYLTEHLLSLGYEVHGLVRRVALEAPRTTVRKECPSPGPFDSSSVSLESYLSIFHLISYHDF